jgi:hypothetical protein
MFKKRLLTMLKIIIGIVLILGFPACGGNDPDEDEDSLGGISSAYDWYGNGSVNSFTISNAAQLAEFAKIVSGRTGEGGPVQSDFKGKTVTLSADINLTDQWVSIGYASPNANPFAGIFDGNGKTISGLYYFNTYGFSGGLFEAVGENGIVKNIVLTDIDITFGYSGGGVVNDNYGTVQNCYVTGSITGSFDVGGVVGTNHGTVQNCSFSGNVNGGSRIGGIAGSNIGGDSVLGQVRNCYATGTVTGSSGSVGGVVGNNGRSGMVQNCYSTNSVNGSLNEVGGVVGYNQSMVQNCYATGSITGNWYVGGVVGNNNGTIRNSVALNTSIIASTINNYVLGRISDNYSSNINFTNNYGLTEMVMRSGYTIVPNANGPDGADVSTDEAATQNWWTTAVNWDFNNVWEWDSARNLPKLRIQ